MTESDAIGQLADAYLARADEALRAARSLHEGQFWRDSVSRSFYAMFYVSALLLTRGLSTAKHAGALALFAREFVKPGMLPVPLSDWIHQANRARMRGDYDPLGPMTGEESLLHLDNGDRFLLECRPVLDRLLQQLDDGNVSDP